MYIGSLRKRELKQPIHPVANELGMNLAALFNVLKLNAASSIALEKYPPLMLAVKESGQNVTCY